MKITTLLLGTAAAIAVAGGARAADLAVAEPVDYVKVCDAYGAGYWYIPGSDTCLKIGGYIRSTITYYSQNKNRDFAGYTASPTGVVTAKTDHPAHWDWKTRTSLQVTTQSMTDIGLLTGFIDYRAESDNSSATGGNNGLTSKVLTYLDSAYVKAGPVKFGYFTNMYYYGGSFGDIDYGDANDAADTVTDQLAFSTSLGGGIGFSLGIADNRDNPGGAGKFKGNMPDIIAALTGASGGFDWKWSAATTDAVLGTGWGTQLAGTYTFENKDAVRAKFAIGNGEGLYYVNNTGPVSGGTYWSAFVAAVHYWSPTVNTSVGGEYSALTSGGNAMWDATIETDWLVTKNFLTGIALGYSDGDTVASVWQVAVRGKRAF